MNVLYFSGTEATQFSEECASIHQRAFSAKGERGWGSNEIESLFRRPSTFLLKAPNGFLLADLTGIEAEIITVAVHPHHQGQQIGSALMSKLDEICRCRNVIKCILEVAEDNDPAIKLYVAFDFEQFAIRKRYFKRQSDSVDALMMAKLY